MSMVKGWGGPKACLRSSHNRFERWSATVGRGGRSVGRSVGPRRAGGPEGGAHFGTAAATRPTQTVQLRVYGADNELSWVSASHRVISNHIFSRANNSGKPEVFFAVSTKQQSRLKYIQSLISISLV
jgi:hypothetical protein